MVQRTVMPEKDAHLFIKLDIEVRNVRVADAGNWCIGKMTNCSFSFYSRFHCFDTKT
jgi:hypothetical protein